MADRQIWTGDGVLHEEGTEEYWVGDGVYNEDQEAAAFPFHIYYGGGVSL